MTSHKPLVLITGASGLIGSAVTRDLARDHRVVTLDIEAPESLPAGAAFIECDLTDDDSVRRTLAKIGARHGRRIASVIHLAAHYDFSGEPSPLYDELTVQGTRRLMQALASFEVEQVVFSSTLLVMHPVELGEALDEGSPTRAEWDYPRSKLEAERALQEERGTTPVCVLRLAGVYDGTGSCLPVSRQLQRIVEKDLESYFFPGDDRHGQPFVHLEDLVDCIRLVVERRAALEPWEVFLVAEPDVMSYGELQDRLGELVHGKAWPSIRIPKPLAKAGAWVQEKTGLKDSFVKSWMIDIADDHYFTTIRKARTELGWEPRHRLRHTLEDIVAALRADPARFYEEKLGEELPEGVAEEVGASRERGR